MKILAWSSKSGSDAIWLNECLEKINGRVRIGGFVTNNPDSPLIEYAQKKGLYICVLNKKPTVDEYLYVASKWNEFSAHFLMGYLRIIPGEVCEKLNMYNLHPGLVNKYPELKGFDPQEKALALKLQSTGSVIHKVIAEVDAGEILYSHEIEIPENETLPNLIRRLVGISRFLWLDLIRDLEKSNDDKIRELSQP